MTGDLKSMIEDEYDSMEESMSGKYIPKQFDMDKLMTIENKELRDMLYGLMTSQSNIFREETQTTLKSYGLIIDEREGSINRLMEN